MFKRYIPSDALTIVLFFQNPETLLREISLMDELTGEISMLAFFIPKPASVIVTLKTMLSPFFAAGFPPAYMIWFAATRGGSGSSDLTAANTSILPVPYVLSFP